MQGEPDERASSEEDGESRACRRIAGALQRDEIDALAAARTGPRSGLARAGQPRPPNDKPGRPSDERQFVERPAAPDGHAATGTAGLNPPR